MRILPFAWLVVLAALTGAAWAEALGPTSEERPPVTCNPGSFVESVTCSGKRCDNVAITCQARTGQALGNAVWTDWVSEEGGGRRSCPARHFIAGLACRNGYCDDVSLYCVELTGAANTTSCTDTRFTENAKPKVSVRDFPDADKGGLQLLASGLRCKGGWCSQIALCTQER
jgi:hypothetical protein